MEYLAVVRPRAVIAQEAEVEQVEAQGVTLKKAIDEPGSRHFEVVIEYVLSFVGLRSIDCSCPWVGRSNASSLVVCVTRRPSAALLEVLGPEQNVAFKVRFFSPSSPVLLFSDLDDQYHHYVTFQLTSYISCLSPRPIPSTVDTTSPPLLDRCQIIQLFGYTHTRNYTLRGGSSSPSKSRRTSFQRHV